MASSPTIGSADPVISKSLATPAQAIARTSPATVSSVTGTETSSGGQVSRSLAPQVSENTVVYNQAIQSTSGNSVTVTSSTNIPPADVVTIYTSPKTVTVSAINQTLNTYKVTNISGGNANTGNIIFDGDNILSTNDIVNIVGNNYAELQSNNTYMWVEDGEADIAVNNNRWIFNNQGYMTIPNDGSFGALNSSVLSFSSQNNNPIYIEVINTGISTAQQWVFDNEGNLTLPDGTILQNGGGIQYPASSEWDLHSSDGKVYIGSVDNMAYIDTYDANIGVRIRTFEDNDWIFDSTGNLTLPDIPNPSINYANGQPYGGGGGGSYGNSNVATFLAAYGSNTITTTGSVSFGDIIGNVANLYGINTSQSISWPGNSQIYEDNDLVVSGAINVDITSPGNTRITSGTYNWDFTNDGNLTTPGNIIIDTGTDGNVESTGNVNIVSNGNTWSFSTTGNLITPGNLVGPASANFTIFANAGVHSFTFGDDGTFYAPDDVVLGGNSIYIGPGANTLSGLSNPVFVASSNSQAYIQAVINNVSDNGSADWVATGHRGNDDGGWVDMGFTSSGFGDANYTITGQGDGYVFTQSFYNGQSPGGRGGNLVLATGVNGTVNDIIFGTGGFLTGNIFGRISNANNALELSRTGASLSVAGNISGGNISTTGNVTVSGWLDGTNTIFTGSITGNVLTVTNAVDGTIAWGQTLYGNSVLAETVITSQITFSSANPGGNGTYRLNQSQTVSAESMSVNSLYLDGDVKLAADHGIYVRDAHDPNLYDNLIGIAEADASILIGSINTNGVTLNNNKEYKVDSNLNPGTYMAVAKVDAADQVILGSGNSANTLIRVGGDSATTGYGMKLVNGGEALIPTGLRIGDNTNSSIFGAPLEVGSILGAAANNQSSPGGIALPTYRGTGTVIANDEWGSYLYGSRYRGTINSPLPVKNGDWLMEFGATAFDGTNNNGGGEIAIRVDGVVSGTNNPSKIEFYNTVSGANNQSLGMVLDASQKLSVSGPVKTIATTLSLLGSAATAGAGARAFATDANLVAAGNFGVAVGGSGGNTVPVYSDGTAWRIG